MAKVAKPRVFSASIGIGNAAAVSGTAPKAVVKRKTPSELRGEQLKRSNFIEIVDDSPSPPPLTGSTSEVNHGLNGTDDFRNSRHIGTRVVDAYPVKKSSFRILCRKENAKEDASVEHSNNLKNTCLLSNLAARKQEISGSENHVSSIKASKDGLLQSCQTINKSSNESKFRTVTELSSAGDMSSGLASINMDKALRGLAAPEPHPSLGLIDDLTQKCGHLASAATETYLSEYHVPGQKAPLDLTLKTMMRVACPSSVRWVHRSVMSSKISKFTMSSSSSEIEGPKSNEQVLHSKALNSWVYPQSVLPPFLVSMLNSSASAGVELEFLQKRQTSWEEAFRNLYYMLRNNLCGIFYVCTSQFVVMFTGGDGTGRSTCSCDAYISRSTAGLRALLKEQDLSFSMPLCNSKVEQVSTEVLVELSEIQKHNLGQTRGLNSFYEVDNTPESLLLFHGNKSVHGLFDFLINYRSFLTFLTGMDVPLLCSPVSFCNAALSTPEIKCMEMRSVEHVAAHSNGANGKEGESTGLCSSIEIKDAVLPPWVISGICAIIGSGERSFDASFMTEPTSIGLNIALKPAGEKSESLAQVRESKSRHTFGISDSIVTSCLCSYSLKGLKYSDGSYKATLSPV